MKSIEKLYAETAEEIISEKTGGDLYNKLETAIKTTTYMLDGIKEKNSAFDGMYKQADKLSETIQKQKKKLIDTFNASV